LPTREDSARPQTLEIYYFEKKEITLHIKNNLKK
jgi:hypothetical protein